MPMSSGNLIRNLIEEARIRRGLRAAASQYIAGRHYDELTPVAMRRLKQLERRAVSLALGTFAYDVGCTTASMIELQRRGAEQEALEEKVALTGRVLGGWAFKHVGLPYPHPSLFEFADSLRLGLGRDLEKWLVGRELSLADAVAWLEEFGPRIERFITYVRRGGKPPSVN